MGYAHGTKWTEELVITSIWNVINTLNIERMPTRAEIKLVMGDDSLNGKISKTGGFKMWAEKLDLKLKESETSFGNEYEFIVKEILEELGYEVEKMTTKHSYDLLVNDNIKIDVKASRYYHSKENDCKYHTFNLEKKYHNCDIFICIGLSENEEIEKLLIIPSKYLMGKKQLSVGVNSMYDRFDKAFEYINKYVDFYNSI